MNFQNLSKIEKANTYLDIAFSRASKKADERRSRKMKNKIEKARQVELMRVNSAAGSLTSRLSKIVLSFPEVDNLPGFYSELVKATTDYPELKRALGALNWAKKQIDKFSSAAQRSISKCQDASKCGEYRCAFYGRVSSVMKQIDKSLAKIEESRKIMKGFPAIKTSLFTVPIFGFPNVGKTTLLYRLTGSKPEISNYAFTTKNINVAYIGDKDKRRRIQLVDTPGSLNRPEKMNSIEMQAHLCLKHLSNMIVYVFDLTEASHSLSNQEELLAMVRQHNPGKKISIYIAKTDLVDTKKVNDFKKKYSSVDDPKVLKKLIEKGARDFYREQKD